MPDVVTDQDKLHLVMQVADEIGRKYGVEPCELWGIGWLACAAAEKTWEKRGPLLGHMRVWAEREIESAASHPNGRRLPILSGD